jgi:hypothetical protein
MISPIVSLPAGGEHRFDQRLARIADTLPAVALGRKPMSSPSHLACFAQMAAGPYVSVACRHA